MKTSTVKVVATQNGNVINAAKSNPKEGWVRLESTQRVFANGYMSTVIRSGFLRGKVADLQAFNVPTELALIGDAGVDISAIDLKGSSLTAGQELPGRIVIVDSLTPISDKDINFGVRIPSGTSNMTPEVRQMVRDAAKVETLYYMKDGKRIYRRSFYSPFPEGHVNYRPDVIIAADNQEEINAFVARFRSTGKANAGITANRETVAA